MLLQKLPEILNFGVFRYRGVQGQTCKMARGRDFIQRVLRGRIAQGKSILQQVNTQHGFQRIGLSATAGLGVERFDQAQQTRPGHDLIHLGEKAFAAFLHALAGVFEIGKVHLAMGGSGQVVRRISAYLKTCSDSLAVFAQWMSDHKENGAYALYNISPNSNG